MVPAAYRRVGHAAAHADRQGRPTRPSCAGRLAWRCRRPHASRRERPSSSTWSSLWSDVLAVEEIGIHDNFFALGGHSLLAARVNARIAATMQVELPMRALFDAPTIAELSREIETLRRGGSAPGLPLEPSGRPSHEPMALSFAQQRLWLLEQFEGELTAYNMPYRLAAARGPGPRSLAASARGLRAAARATPHDVHRGRRRTAAGRPGHRALRAAARRPPWPGDRTRRPNRSHGGAGTRRSAPFDLTRDLLLRGALLRLDEHEHVLLLTMHHIASDGWSLSVLWRELGLQYDALCRGVEPRTAAVARSVCGLRRVAAPRAGGLASRTAGAVLARPVAGLDCVGIARRPAPARRPHVISGAGESSRSARSSRSAEGAEPAGERHAADDVAGRIPNTADALHRPAGPRHRGANRRPQSHALEGLVGYFVNILVLRTDVSGDPTFRELLRRVRAVSLDAYDHQDLPFERLVEQLQPQRHASRSPLVQVLFQLLSFSDTGPALPQLEVSRVPLTHQRVRFDLEMHLWQQARNIRGRAGLQHGPVRCLVDRSNGRALHDVVVGHRRRTRIGGSANCRC